MLKLLLFISTMVVANDQIENINTDLEKIGDERGISSDERQQKFAAYLQSQIKPFLDEHHCNSLNEVELKGIFKTFRTLSFYLQSNDVVIGFKDCLEVAFAKQMNLEVESEHYLQALVNNRNFNELLRFNQQINHQEYIDFPAIKTNLTPKDTPAVFEYNVAHQLIRKEFTFKANTEVLVMTHPLCGFTKQAISDIGQHEELKALLSEHSRWLVPPSTRLEIEALVEWNQDYPDFQLSYIDQAKDFPNKDYWGTPTFYFLKNGEIIDIITGWPRDGSQLAVLHEKIKKHFPKYSPK